MLKDSTTRETIPALLQELLKLLEAHRPAFRQERTFRRSEALALGELFAFARHTVTQSLLALGLTDSDWSGWYRLFSRERYSEEELSHCLFKETLRHVEPEEAYVMGVDGTQVPRSSRKMPGTSWLRAPRTAVFQRGIHRAQRFEHGAWLAPIEEGYSRAIPLRWLPAFPPKAVPAEVKPCREWEAGLEMIGWVRQGLDEAGRSAECLVVLGDGAYDTVEFWKGLPERVVGVVRTARNRKLRQLPEAQEGRGRRRKYGAVAPHPADWLAHPVGEKWGWQKRVVKVRGRHLEMRYRIEGPYLREGAGGRPLWLLVIGGNSWKAGKKEPKRRRKEPAFYLISAVRQGDRWELPLPIEELLAWVWQRWELEVAHREMKSGLGVGEKQCWGKRSTVVAVQWSVWVYGVMLLGGYRAWGLFGGPKAPGRWWPGAKRWSLNTLWRGYRAALWGNTEFRATWTITGDNWPNKETWLAGLQNAIAGAARA